jgi:uncharacterized phiE125 gp8 family phage protein
MRTEVKVVSTTGSEPITAAQAKAYLKQEYGVIASEDVIIERQITAARQLCEAYIDSSIVEKTIRTTFFEFQEWDYYSDGSVVLELPRGPVKSLTSVKKQVPGVSDETLTLNGNYYKLGQDWPRIKVSVAATVTTSAAYDTDGYLVEYVAGMTSVDAPLVEGMLKTIADMYVNRGNETVEGSVAQLTYDAKMLWNPYRQTINA